MQAPHGTFENPRPYDILCGRNRNSFNNIGNRRFRITISMNVEKYNSIHSRIERSKFIASLAQTLRYEVGFRFLKRTSGGENNSGTAELSDDEIRAKVGHALRDMAAAIQQNGEDKATPESKVPRPGPYKKQDKSFEQEPLRIVSSSSLEAMSSSGPSSTLDETTAEQQQQDNKPTSAPLSSQVSSDRLTSIQEQDTMDSAAPDQVRSCSSPPLHLMSSKLPTANDMMTPLISNKDKGTNAISQDEDDYFPLDIEDACHRLLEPIHHMIPSLDDHDDFEMDDFWTTIEPLNDHSVLSIAKSSNMSIGASSCDMMSLPSYVSDAMETLSLVSL